MPKPRSHAKRTSSKNSGQEANPRYFLKNLSSSKKLKNLLGVVFVILGFLFLYKLPALPSVSKSVNREPIVASHEYKKDEKALSVVRILLPNEHIDLKVTPAKLINGYWQTTESGASQGEGTANPGTGGNVVIFAHAREGMFYNLKDVKKDEIIYVFTKDKWFRYKVSEIRTVYPKDVATVAPTKQEELTLFTCSGFFDEKRLIVKAKPIK